MHCPWTCPTHKWSHVVRQQLFGGNIKKTKKQMMQLISPKLLLGLWPRGCIYVIRKFDGTTLQYDEVYWIFFLTTNTEYYTKAHFTKKSVFSLVKLQCIIIQIFFWIKCNFCVQQLAAHRNSSLMEGSFWKKGKNQAVARLRYDIVCDLTTFCHFWTGKTIFCEYLCDCTELLTDWDLGHCCVLFGMKNLDTFLWSVFKGVFIYLF